MAASLSSTARGGEPAGERPEPGAQGDVQTVGHEGDEDVSLDALLELMVDGPQPEIVLEGLERRFDLDQLDVEAPQLCGVLPGQVGAQQIAALAPAHLP